MVWNGLPAVQKLAAILCMHKLLLALKFIKINTWKVVYKVENSRLVNVEPVCNNRTIRNSYERQQPLYNKQLKHQLLFRTWNQKYIKSLAGHAPSSKTPEKERKEFHPELEKEILIKPGTAMTLITGNYSPNIGFYWDNWRLAHEPPRKMGSEKKKWEGRPTSNANTMFRYYINTVKMAKLY